MTVRRRDNKGIAARQFRTALATALGIVALSGARVWVRANETCRLEKVPLDKIEWRFPFETWKRSSGLLDSPRRDIPVTGVPAGIHDIRFGSIEHLPFVVGSSRPGGEIDRLIVDCNDDGSLEGESLFEPSGRHPILFGPFRVPGQVFETEQPVSLCIALDFVSEPSRPVLLLPGEAMVGRMRTRNRECTVALIDRNFNGRYNDGAPGKGYVDQLFVDVNGDHTIDSRGYCNPEVFELMEIMHIGGEYYDVAPSEDGTSLRYSIHQAPRGFLSGPGVGDLGELDIHVPGKKKLRVIPTNEQRRQRKVPVPVGTYRVGLYGLYFQRRGDDGEWWTMQCHVPKEANTISFSPGQATQLKWEPRITALLDCLLAPTHVEHLDAGNMRLYLRLDASPGDCRCEIEKGNNPVLPRFALSDDEGNIVLTGTYRRKFGALGYFHEIWKAPEDLPERLWLRPDVDLGPFEVSVPKAQEIWVAKERAANRIPFQGQDKRNR